MLCRVEKPGKCYIKEMNKVSITYNQPNQTSFDSLQEKLTGENITSVVSLLKMQESSNEEGLNKPS